MRNGYDADRRVKMSHGNDSLPEYKRQEMIRMARQLCYKPIVIERLKGAKTKADVERIMRFGRKAC